MKNFHDFMTSDTVIAVTLVIGWFLFFVWVLYRFWEKGKEKDD